jgi:hypothetical protein
MTQRFGIENEEEFKNLATNLRIRIEQIPLDETRRVEANADLSTIEAQIRSPDPKTNVLRACMVSLRTILDDRPRGPLTIATISLIRYWHAFIYSDCLPKLARDR